MLNDLFGLSVEIALSAIDLLYCVCFILHASWDLVDTFVLTTVVFSIVYDACFTCFYVICAPYYSCSIFGEPYYYVDVAYWFFQFSLSLCLFGLIS